MAQWRDHHLRKLGNQHAPHELTEPTDCLADFDFDFARATSDLLELLSGFGGFGLNRFGR